MKKTVAILIAFFAFTVLMNTWAMAHTPLCSCSDEGDGTILCEGAFSDGSSAAGVEIRVQDSAGKVLIKGRMNDDSEFAFDKPKGPYKVQFDAGPGHLVEVPSSEIME